MSKATVFLERVVQRELGICLWLNRACRYSWIREFFATISWLGDGKFWYTLMLLLPIWYGKQGLSVTAEMAVVGIVALALYKIIKSSTVRPRPYTVHHAINNGTAPLDHYSFPSGHTMHAVGFTMIATEYFPALGWILLPFAALVALSRVILGLHYPTDVVIGATIGFTLASTSFTFLTF